MRFTIITNKPGHQPPQSSCDFLPPGGTIGRGTDNNLVLPDDDRTISRLQAIVHISANGECRITNRGNVTLVLLNDIPLERGRQVELQDGDVLGIDDYQLLVNEIGSQIQPAFQAATPRPVIRPAAQPASAQHAEPAAQAIAQPAQYMAQPSSQPSAQPSPQATAPAQNAAQSGDNKPAAIPTEIWDSLVAEFSISDSLSAARKNTTLEEAASLHNPFAAAPAPERNPDDPLAQLLASDAALKGKKQSSDPTDLFATDGVFDGHSIFDDSSPSTLAKQASVHATGGAKSDSINDPLALFGGNEQSAASEISHDDPLGLLLGGAKPLTQASVKPTATDSQPEQDTDPRAGEAQPAAVISQPKAVENSQPAVDSAQAEQQTAPVVKALYTPNEEPATSPELAELEASPLFAELPSNQEISESTADYSGITLPTPQAVQRNPSSPPKGRLRIDPVEYPGQSPGNRDTGAAQSKSTANGNKLDGELLQALIDGMGLNDLQPVPSFDKDQMYQLGQMLSMFSQGTVALLSSRSILKRGVKAEMTVILDEANNPFKLLPSGKSVLMQMYGSRMPGFMAPSQSVRDALIDLQAHQLGMISGIRAIIASMLQSFNPEQLEAEAREEGITSRIGFSNSRKAALWDHFAARYKETAGEIEDDFHTLFGEAFLHAYDMEVNQYKDSQNRSDK